MKKAILVLVVVGMFGWTVYDFTSSTGETSVEENNSSDGAKITSPPSAGEESQVEESDEIGLSVGQIAPDFTLETLEGETVQLSDYRGQRVIVNFWATWCPPCRAEIPDFQKLYENKDVEILAVDLTETETSIEDVRAFVKEYDMTFPVPMDENSDVSETYQVMAYPTSYMIDSSGHIQYVAMGAMNYDLMVQELEKME
ncbi:redoxin domain-containing protein [Lentibacillus sp. CBA3610]|uniref:TlpA family protein disulfide reductase n=1 Tax=Lentibacillus sp. CBA3610 TaxID=2518176 RepID=UPI001595A6FE|nr:redoxin domain-containing protein [Lentibacillus sp. CBA3610]QKY71400.1 redoxin domain-containing protein [Lentibacillus sp. CBA3610]